MARPWAEIERLPYGPKQAKAGRRNWRENGVRFVSINLPLPGNRALAVCSGNMQKGLAPSIVIGRWEYVFIRNP